MTLTVAVVLAAVLGAEILHFPPLNSAAQASAIAASPCRFEFSLLCRIDLNRSKTLVGTVWQVWLKLSKTGGR